MIWPFTNSEHITPFIWIYLFVVMSIIIFGRYVVLSKLYLRFVHRPIKLKSPMRVIARSYHAQQRTKEIVWSGISSFIFSGVALLMYMGYNADYTAIYTELGEMPIWYIPLSLLGALILHETYYYWMHRVLHWPSIYRYVHRVHHDSRETSVWTSFSFHPIESVLQAVIIPIITLIIPLHLGVLIFWLLLMTISAFINHAGVEIYPKSWIDHPVLKYLIGSTHHDLHHRKFVKNYGLYFSFWDRWMGTESTAYEDKFLKATSKPASRI